MASPALGLPPDVESLCRLARAIPDKGSSRRPLSPKALEKAIHTAQAHNALGVILPSLRRRRKTLPLSLDKRLIKTEAHLTAQALFRENELRKVLHVLDAAGVETTLLKGAFLASCVYDDFVERPMSDFDIFVRREDLPQAAAALHNAGYLCTEGWPNPVCLAGALHFTSPAGQAIELRYDLTQGTRLRGAVTFHEEEMWARRRTFTTRAKGTLCSLDPTDHLLYLAYHAGILHLFTALIWLIDIDRFIRRFHKEITWTDLPKRARQIGCATCLWHCLGLTQQLLGTPIEESVLQALTPSASRATLIHHWLTPERLLRGMTPPPHLLTPLVQLLLLDTTGADLRSLWHGLFPPKEWLKWRYQTSNPLTLLLLRTFYPLGGWARHLP